MQIPKDEYEKIKTLEDYQSWRQHPYTEKVFKELDIMHNDLSEIARNQAALNPKNTEILVAMLNQAKAIYDVKDFLSKPPSFIILK